jgi:hypothetical protein
MSEANEPTETTEVTAVDLGAEETERAGVMGQKGSYGQNAAYAYDQVRYMSLDFAVRLRAPGAHNADAVLRDAAAFHDFLTGI